MTPRFFVFLVLVLSIIFSSTFSFASEEDFGFEPESSDEETRSRPADYSISDVGTDLIIRERPSQYNFFDESSELGEIGRSDFTPDAPNIPAPPPQAPALPRTTVNNARQNQQRAQQQSAEQPKQAPQNQQQAQNLNPFAHLINGECLSLLNACREERSDTATQCNADAEGNTGQRQAQGSLSQIGRQLSAASARSGQGGAAFCATMSSVSAAANSSVAGLTYTCGEAQNSCKSKCGELITKINSNQCQPLAQAQVSHVTREEARREATENREQCQRLAARAAESSQAMARAASDLLTQSQRCIDQQHAGGLAGFCQSNPTSVACMTLANNDCTSEQAARTNPVCICRANPGHSDCRLVAAVNHRAGSLDSSGAGGAQLLRSGSGGGSVDFSEQSSMSMSDAGPSGAAAAVGGRKFMKQAAEGEGLAPNAAPGRRSYAGDASDQARIYRGNAGSRVNGSGWNNGTTQGQRQQGSVQNARYIGDQNGKIDLRAFLPDGSRDPNAPTAAEKMGISNAYGKSNFEKIADKHYEIYLRGETLREGEDPRVSEVQYGK